MAWAERTTVVGVFADRNDANRAIVELRNSGFRSDQIGIASRGDEWSEPLAEEVKVGEEGSKWEEGALTGALTGAGLGGLVGLGILAGVIPAIGPAIAGGTLGIILANAAGGAALTGIAGALVGAGIPEEEARSYESELHAGRTIVTVQADGRGEEARAILLRNGAASRDTAATATATPVAATTPTDAGVGLAPASTGDQGIPLSEEGIPAGAVPIESGEDRVPRGARAETGAIEVPDLREAGAAAGDTETSAAATTPTTTGTGHLHAQPGEEMIALHEEELRAHKQPVETGEVRVHKDVTTETKTVEVPVQREEVVIERRPVSGEAVTGAEINEGEEIRIPVREEQVRVEKQPVVKEEVRVGKQTVQDTEQVSDTVRKEHLRVEREGDVDVREGGTPTNP